MIQRVLEKEWTLFYDYIYVYIYTHTRTSARAYSLRHARVLFFPFSLCDKVSRSSFDPFSNLHIKYISIVVVVVVVMSFTPRPVSFAKTDRPSSMLSSAKAQLGRVFSRLTSGSTPPSQREEKDLSLIHISEPTRPY